MQDLSSVVLIAEIILFLALAVLAVYLIFAIKRIVRSVETIEKNVDELQKKANPMLESSLSTLNDINLITGEVKKQMGKVNDIVDSFKDTADSLIEFEQKAQKQIEGPVFESLNLISAIYTGVKTFITRLTESTNNRPRKKSIETD